jgi:MFS family permease
VADVARAPLGRDFTRLWAASGISNLGDGVYAAAMPLLAARLTSDPFPVAAVTFATWLPWLLFGLLSGALVDRWERRRVMFTVDAARVLVVGGLGLAVLTGHASIPLLLVTGFLLGTGQTLVDTASHSIVPAIVSRAPGRLERANGRLIGTQMLADGFIGPPVGGILFAVAPWSPFLIDAVSFGAGSLLVRSIRGGRVETPEDRPGLWASIAEGLRWLGRHRLLRAMAGMVALVNLMATATQATAVLFATRVLGLGSTGYGVLLAATAVGGVIGSVIAPRLAGWVPPGTLILIGFLANGAALAGVGLTSSPVVAATLLAVESLFVIVFNVVVGSLRQQLSPDHMLGRVVSAFRLFSYGAVPIGALLGGAIATWFGLRAPYLVGGIGVALAALIAAPLVNNRSIAEARAAVSP